MQQPKSWHQLLMHGSVHNKRNTFFCRSLAGLHRKRASAATALTSQATSIMINPHLQLYNKTRWGGRGYLGGAQVHATVDAAEDFLVLLEAAGLASSHAEATSVAGRRHEAGGLEGGGGGGGGEVGGGGALHLLHAVVPTVVMVRSLHGTNPACLHLQVNDKFTSRCYRRCLLAGWWPHRHCNRHSENDRLARKQ